MKDKKFFKPPIYFAFDLIVFLKHSTHTTGIYFNPAVLAACSTN